MKYNLQRFIDAQQIDYPIALDEIRSGRKCSHWMWYIFPQIAGLGFSPATVFYSIKNLEEAIAYINHPLLGKRLIEISNVLLNLEGLTANLIFGKPDDRKLKSCMTLFSLTPAADPVFGNVLDKYFAGERDEKTLKLLADTENSHSVD